jgi:uncharacterized protein (TIGR02231 family)
MSTMELGTKIVDVVVYGDRARVTRAGETAVDIGALTAVISDLPGALDPRTIRASGHGSAACKLVSVDASRTFSPEPAVERIASLENEIERLQESDRALADDFELHQAAADHAKALLSQSPEALARGVAFGRASTSEIAAFEAHAREMIASECAAARASEAERRQVGRQIRALERELDDISGPKPRERYAAHIELEVESAGSIILELRYEVPGASWTPLYDARLGDPNTVELSYLAEVKQHTGEAWENASLTLSTARPSLAATIPDLKPWYIGPRPMPRMMAAKASGALMLADAMPEAENAPAPMVRAAQPLSATIERSGLALTYVLPREQTIPSDGAPHKVAVAVVSLPCDIDQVLVPKMATCGHRRAKITNNSKLALLPGQMAVFWDGEFVSSTKLESVAPGADFEAFLGVDEALRAERELVDRAVDRRVIGNRRRIRFSYRIRVMNDGPVSAEVTVIDHIPVSRHEDVSAKLADVQPEPTDETLGVIEWEISLEPGTEQTVEYGYVVEHPREMRIGSEFE